MPAGEARGQQIAPGRGFPVEHFAGTEDARQFAQHQRILHCLEPHAAGAADRLGQWTRTLEPKRQALDGACKQRNVIAACLAEGFVQ